MGHRAHRRGRTSPTRRRSRLDELLPNARRAPIVGRPFAPGESSPGQWNVAVISHALWLAQFGGDSSVLGRVVQMDNTPTQIVGVMPAGFEAFQATRRRVAAAADRSRVALLHGPNGATASRDSLPTRSLASATAEVATLVPQMREQFNYSAGIWARRNGRLDARVPRRQRSTVVARSARRRRRSCCSLPAPISAISCSSRRSDANESSPYVARSARRADRWRGNLLVQSVMLAIAGGLLGTTIGVFGVKLLKSILPNTLPMLGAVSVDWRVLLLSAVVTLVIGLAFGIAPALLATRVDPEGALRISGAGSTSRTERGDAADSRRCRSRARHGARRRRVFDDAVALASESCRSRVRPAPRSQFPHPTIEWAGAFRRTGDGLL